tara:strand:+ start:1463 stop:2938 length:1476 start_codon:yes stop_codon:yes gene_type:complete
MKLNLVYLFVVTMFVFNSCTDKDNIQNSSLPVENEQTHKKTTEEKREFIPGQYIVILKENQLREVTEAAAQRTTLKINQVLSATGLSRDSVFAEYKYATKGFATRLNPQQVELLKLNPLVDRVVKNQRYRVGSIVSDADEENSLSYSAMHTSQTVPWGTTRVGGPHEGTGLTAWVIDSGVDLDHPDLNVDVANSVNFVSGEINDDLLGHGTHVAGIIAAKNNSSYTVGVAAGATIVSVKTCDQDKKCSKSNILSGIDYVTLNASYGDIINMSIWTNLVDPDLDDAVLISASSGLRYVIIAGNARRNANTNSPGRANDPNIWTVTAFDQNDDFASYFCSGNPFEGSNYGGSEIEYSAPGVDILSLYKNASTKTFCGTSMAAPHVAGLLLITAYSPSLVTTDGTVNNDRDPVPDNIPVYHPLEVNVSGPSSLDSGVQGTWTATPVNGQGASSYQWYYRVDGTSPWISAGSNSNSFSWTFTNSTSSGYCSRCKS